ncbi:MAG: EAL domain-containing protein [Pseudodesulfovibrio sp.]|uniref:Diguanylate cyclase n=1 Tax=Pseudodesulfovibrio aespoeensis (strain ATCC 700646 / DSM 10631 / Aspo-2) TaxID=643562 RepID=E6VWG2_PSEA9|nr:MULTISPECIES: EAL domain-containing protein [Pseudodesulfovibrio]MBU4378529.1 EAL domain-containing protein [Pseudomonadota bacterium]ADU61368.1 diguanylate cyclase [Pseudodesulfovibrio aespoeensis Aspo-2]MBU4474761.1 EAL domain-containing protein [Pseudomonadota bacterium]MBU4516368.1 EAL domain-containing protein [Pseudomonadota bacterium]MBU4522550.1 EAL domain-containing protein [Pseudomonadota bacterium]
MRSRRLSDIFEFTTLGMLLPAVLTLALFGGSIFLYLLPSLQQAFMDDRRASIRELTGAVINTLSHLHQRAENGEIAPDDARRMGKELLRAMRYGPEGKDYFWINDDTPRMIMHPYRPEMEGQDLSDYKDPQGKPIFLEFIRAAGDPEGGFVDYSWQWKDQPDIIARKVSYVREFQPWGWIVGTGIYIDDVMQELAGYRNRLTILFVSILLIVAGLEFYVLRQISRSAREKAKIRQQRERLLEALRTGEERYRTIADFAYDWEIWLGTEGGVLYCSPACERISGHPPERYFEQPELLREIIVSEDRDAWDKYLLFINNEVGGSLDFRIVTRSGQTRWLCVAGRAVSGIGMKPLGIRCSFRDITDRKEMEEQLRHQALHDPLTELANRTLCLDRVGQAMRRAGRRENYYFALVFLDLDRFKVINDSLGHRFGDLVLMETANRLAQHVRTLDTVSRFGGDEFVLLLDELASPGEAIRIVKRIRDALAKPFIFTGHEVQTTASFGIVLSPIPDIRASDVLQRANIAMHQAKEAGRNRFKVFTTRMLESAVDQLTMENDMRRGLESGEFHVQYQPIMDLDGSDIMGFEALARWDHPERGPIPPAEFIPMAEESGTIIKLGEWVLRESLLTLARWRAATPGAQDIFMSVNLSSKQFARMELDKLVIDALRAADLPPEVLKLEITETALMEHPDAAINVLKRLRKIGVRFSIDDFGTGYSSLSQLQQLPVDTLKVDRSFISRMKSDPENMEIVRAVIALAHSLGLDVVAEGVEDAGQLCSLMELKCESVQGFYFHRPLSPTDAEDLLHKRAAQDHTSPRQRMTDAQQGCLDQAEQNRTDALEGDDQEPDHRGAEST